MEAVHPVDANEAMEAYVSSLSSDPRYEKVITLMS